MDKRGLNRVRLVLLWLLAVAMLGAGFLPVEASVVIETDAQGRLLPLPDGFPRRAITVATPFGPGHSDSILARRLAEAAQHFSPVPVIIRAEAAGPRLQFETLERLSLEPGGKEGYFPVLASMTGTAVRMHTTNMGVTEDEMARTALMSLEQQPYVISVRAGGPFDDFEGMVEWAKANPGRLRAAVAGAGGAINVTLAMYAQQKGFSYLPIPHDQGHTAAIITMLGGGAEVAVTGTVPILPYVEDGRAKVILQSTQERSSILPDVPAAGELGLTAVPRLSGLAVHLDTPEDHRAWLIELFTRAAMHPHFREFVEQTGSEVYVGLVGDEFGQWLKNLSGEMKPIIYSLGLGR